MSHILPNCFRFCTGIFSLISLFFATIAGTKAIENQRASNVSDQIRVAPREKQRVSCLGHVRLTLFLANKPEDEANATDGPNTKTSNNSTVEVEVLFFASAREAVGGLSELKVTLEGNNTTAGLRQRLAQDYPRLANMVLDEDSITLALNEEYVDAGQVLDLHNGDTVALIPPISGG